MQNQSLPTLVLSVILCFTLIALILYLLTLGKVLNKCAPASRAMEPGKVWLMLIPVFGLVWQFIIVMNIAKSLGNEFARLGIPCPEPTPGQTIGLAMCVCNCCIFIPLLGGLVSIAGLVLWIVYWIRIANYSRLLTPDSPAPPAPHPAHPTAFVHSSTQSFTVFHHSREFCGFSTQCPSSGKYSILLGTFSRCSV
jgi:hypothetical protein